MLDIADAALGSADFDLWRRDARFADIDAHPFLGGFGRAYYPAVYGTARACASFAVTDEQRHPLLLAPCSRDAASLDWYGLPLRLVTAADLPAGKAAQAHASALAHLEAMALRYGLANCIVEDPGSGTAALSPLGEACLGRGWRAGVAFHGRCDLAGGEPALRAGLRKSFRSLVNWGRTNLRLEYVDAANPDRAAFDAYRDFHARVAGRSTRPDASWDAMFAWIAGGGGELSLGRLDNGELVTATMVVDGRSVSYYASGVYDRERFDKPMAHFPLYDAILRAGARGMATFDLGELPQADKANAKEVAIGYFKRGFAQSIVQTLRWSLPTTRSQEAAG